METPLSTAGQPAGSGQVFELPGEAVPRLARQGGCSLSHVASESERAPLGVLVDIESVGHGLDECQAERLVEPGLNVARLSAESELAHGDRDGLVGQGSFQFP